MMGEWEVEWEGCIRYGRRRRDRREEEGLLWLVDLWLFWGFMVIYYVRKVGRG
jgi:hypothetical protein